MKQATYHAPDVLEEIKVAENIDTSDQKPVPVHTLQFHVGVILLEVEVDSFKEVHIWSFDAEHVLSSHTELIEVEVLWKYLHFYDLYYKYI